MMISTRYWSVVTIISFSFVMIAWLCLSVLFCSPIRVNLKQPENTMAIFHLFRQPLFWLCIPLVLFLSCMPQVLILYIRRTYFYSSSDILQEVAWNAFLCISHRAMCLLTRKGLFWTLRHMGGFEILLLLILINCLMQFVHFFLFRISSKK